MIVLLIIAGYILCGLLSWALDMWTWKIHCERHNYERKKREVAIPLILHLAFAPATILAIILSA
tara:strand:- start:228 stop:419 length:192 start_codon:yes stop_codon:yes gene_type:complete